MLFTRQLSSAGQPALQDGSLSWLTSVSKFVINWRPLWICPSSVGSRSGQFGQPGFSDFGNRIGSTPSGWMQAQNHVSMKNTRKESGMPASDKLRAQGPLSASNPDDPGSVENQVFFEKPTPRPPESPDVESLRSLLKANMTQEKASPALLQRIRSKMHEHKA